MRPLSLLLLLGSLTIAGAIGGEMVSDRPVSRWLHAASAMALALGVGLLATDLSERRMERKLRSEQLAALPELPPVPGWNVPPPTTSFSGRGDLLRKLEGDFTRHRVVALTGIGGVGKTQIARRYAYDHQAGYAHAFWVSAATPAHLDTGYLEIARRLGLGLEGVADQEQIKQAVRDTLGRLDRWLLIFDNVENPVLVRKEYFPEGTRGHILLTMQAPPPPDVAFGRWVERMSAEEGAGLLLQRAGRLTDRQGLADARPKDQAEAKAFSREAGGLPLALGQAGGYMARSRLTPGEYRKRWASAGELLRLMRGDQVEHAPVATTFCLAFRMSRQIGGPGKLLCLCAFLDPEMIPEELFTGGAHDLPEGLRRALADPLGWDAVIGAATRLGLLQRDGVGRSLAIHRKVQAELRDWMRSTQRHWAERAVRLVARAYPSPEFGKTWEACQRLLPCAEACLKAITDPQRPMAFLEAAVLLHRAGSYLKDRGQHAAAEPFLFNALAIREKVLAPDDPDLAVSHGNLGILYAGQGNYTEAERHLKEALAIREKVLPPNHPDTARTHYNLALLCQRQGGLGEAGERARLAHEKWLASLGAAHPDTQDARKLLDEIESGRGAMG